MIWKKLLYDETIEEATEEALLAKKASWTRGRQDIQSATIWLKGRLAIMSFPEASKFKSNWMQTDHNIFSFNDNKSLVIARDLSCQLPEEQMYLEYKTKDNVASFLLSTNKNLGQPIPLEHKEVILTLNLNGQVDIGFK